MLGHVHQRIGEALFPARELERQPVRELVRFRGNTAGNVRVGDGGTLDLRGDHLAVVPDRAISRSFCGNTSANIDVRDGGTCILCADPTTRVAGRGLRGNVGRYIRHIRRRPFGPLGCLLVVRRASAFRRRSFRSLVHRRFGGLRSTGGRQQGRIARLPLVFPTVDDLLQRIDHERAALRRHRRGDDQHAVLVVPA